MLLARSEIDPHRVSVFGRGLAGAVAIALLAERPYDLVSGIVCNTFTSVKQVIKSKYPCTLRLVQCLIPDAWNSIERMERIYQPMLFISSTEDEYIPSVQMEELADSAMNPEMITFLSLEGAGHYDAPQATGYSYKIKEFLYSI
jgi:fermentation-respiration switch protein FrsA (DUF1100 family)